MSARAAPGSRASVVHAAVERQRNAKRLAPLSPTPPARRARLLALLRETPAADADSQAARMLCALSSGPITSHEARQFLDVLHPAGRIKTLRDRGHEIATLWVVQMSACGKPHRIGEWSLTGRASA